MQQVYLTYAPEDRGFARRLAHDLSQHDINCTLADLDSSEQFEALQRSSVVLVALSKAATKDARVLATLDAATRSNRRFIALRIGAIDELPAGLKGVLPLDFSSEELYEDGFSTLLDDLQPPTWPVAPLLPPEVQTALGSDDPNDRKRGVELLGGMRHHLDPDIRALAQHTLRDLAFKDPEAALKTLARTTLQLFDADEQIEVEVLEDVKTAPLVPEHAVEVGVPVLPETPTPARLQPQFTPLWATPEWWLLPVAGVILALIHAVLAREWVIVLPISFVWISLPWFNIVMRDRGRLDWKMPGPLIGNAVSAFFAASLALLVGATIEDVALIDALDVMLLTVLHGGFIGWISTLYKR